MSDFATHLAAIGVGVVITLLLVGGLNKKAPVANEAVNEQSAAKTTTNGQAAKKKNKKKKKKPQAAAPAASTSPPAPAVSAAPVAAPKVAPAPAPSPATAPSEKKKKAKKNKKSGSVTTTNGTGNETKKSVPSPAPAPAPKKTPTPAPPVAAAPLPPPRVVQEEVWETIPKKKKKKNATQKRAEAAAAAAIATAAEAKATAAVETKISLTVTIDASRVGIIIGPKGATMNAIQEKTGTKLDVNAPKPGESTKQGANQFRPVVGGKKPTASIVITEGTPEMQKAAKKAILELAERGYAALLQAEGFGETSVAVHPRFLSEIVGAGGKTIKSIQSALDVKLTIPKTDWTPKTLQIGNVEPSVRVGIAGDSPQNVKTAKQVIKDLCTYHHHEITHPGMIHQEVYVPQEFFHCVIGPRGSEIKHIRGNFKVEIYMPSEESWCTTENVVCVGKSNDVEKAINYIKLLMDRDSELREQKYSDEGYGDDSLGW